MVKGVDPVEMRLEPYAQIKDATVKASSQLDVYAITRLQDASSLRINVVDGRLDSIQRGSIRGTGIQVFTKEGRSGFAAVTASPGKKS